MALFRRSGALLEGHFRLSSGLHSPGYLQCALVLQHPARRRSAWRGAGRAASAPLGATCRPVARLGGIVIGQEVARALDVRALFAERQDGTLTLRRGFALSPDDKVLVVEDVVTTAGSTRETMAVARAAGARWSARAPSSIEAAATHGLEVPFAALLPMHLPTYQEAECPLCKQACRSSSPALERSLTLPDSILRSASHEGQPCGRGCAESCRSRVS